MNQKLGEGGFGEVWLAEDAKEPSRKTVFKFCTWRSKLRSLQREYDIYNQLQRKYGNTPPGLAEVRGAHDSGKPPYYLQLEYVAGGNLIDWIEGPGKEVSQRITLDVALQMVRAVARIHDAGFIHRDLKPANFLVERGTDANRAPEIKLCDFGIGHQVLHDAVAIGQCSQEISGHKPVFNLRPASLVNAAGTYLFIAPELLDSTASLSGRVNRDALPAADPYSLGVSLYQLFVGSSHEVPGVGLSRLHDDCLREDLTKCLDPDPNQRPSATELLQSLDNYERRRLNKETALRLAAQVELAKQKIAKKRAYGIAIGYTLLLISLIIAIVYGVYRRGSDFVESHPMYQLRGSGGTAAGPGTEEK